MTTGTSAVLVWEGPTAEQNIAEIISSPNIHALGLPFADGSWVYMSRAQDALTVARLLYGYEGTDTAKVTRDSCCLLVRPHAMPRVGEILEAILSSSGSGGVASVAALGLYQFSQREAEEFLTLYETVVGEYGETLRDLCAGRALVVELEGPAALSEAHEMVGPRDPSVARQIRPNSLRAIFGHSRGANGLHCTDLAQDGQREAHFIFRRLPRTLFVAAT
eukprot:GHVU01090400.1.p1 GENE.GHVU01090400.1~~GHVU01090400.1.p1  ORF type:complete len:253 (-),score=35.90 GHVU01090400.1:163-822(-)